MKTYRAYNSDKDHKSIKIGVKDIKKGSKFMDDNCEYSFIIERLESTFNDNTNVSTIEIFGEGYKAFLSGDSHLIGLVER